MPRLIEPLKRRVELACGLRGVSYPWWIPASSVSASVGFTVLAVVQRGALHAGVLIWLAGLLALTPLLFFLFVTRLLPKTFEFVLTLAAVAMLLTKSVHGPDFAPLILILVAAEVAAIADYVLAVAATVIAATTIVLVAAAAHTLEGSAIYATGIGLGLWVGIAMRWQMRAITAERLRREAAEERAVLAERQRIAREVHDVVGHSLSVTLLHLTGARLALQEDGDTAEAMQALVDAERIGRAAMADLRRSVGLLATNSSGTEPLPSLADLPALVDRTRAAGIDVSLSQQGDLAPVGTSAGLGLYRIAQESLANIVKHAPTSQASVSVGATNREVRMVIRNELTESSSPGSAAGGIGLPSMAARAEQIGATLKAGPSGSSWVVEVVAPLGSITDPSTNEMVTS